MASWLNQCAVGKVSLNVSFWRDPPGSTLTSTVEPVYLWGDPHASGGSLNTSASQANYTLTTGQLSSGWWEIDATWSKIRRPGWSVTLSAYYLSGATPVKIADIVTYSGAETGSDARHSLVHLSTNYCKDIFFVLTIIGVDSDDFYAWPPYEVPTFSIAFTRLAGPGCPSPV